MIKQNTSVAAFKVWIFPTLGSILAMMIWNDVSEIKSDVKALMAQSNIDKTRIDNLERQLYKTTKYPAQLPLTPIVTNMVAILPNNEIKIKNEKVLPRSI